MCIVICAFSKKLFYIDIYLSFVVVLIVNELFFVSGFELFAQESLCVLNISNNNIDDIRDMVVLKELQHFSAADNKLYNMEVNIAF